LRLNREELLAIFYVMELYELCQRDAANSRDAEMSTKTKFRIPPQSKFKGLRLDPEIVELIIELNEAGFITYGSCAGHPSVVLPK